VAVDDLMVVSRMPESTDSQWDLITAVGAIRRLLDIRTRHGVTGTSDGARPEMGDDCTMLSSDCFDQGFAEARGRFEHDGDIEAVLVLLRNRGFSMIEAINVIRRLGSVELGQARRIAHHSQAYSDQREARDEAFRRAVAHE